MVLMVLMNLELQVRFHFASLMVHILLMVLIHMEMDGMVLLQQLQMQMVDFYIHLYSRQVILVLGSLIYQVRLIQLSMDVC
jgi:hypothetical protein